MAATLELGETLYLEEPLRKGKVLAFKSQQLDLTPRDLEPTVLQLRNKANEIVLQILIRRRRDEVVFNARALLSLLDGWGENETISDIAGAWSSKSRFTISVHDCGDKYQILFNLTTVHCFLKRFSVESNVVRVTYRQGVGDKRAATLSQSLKVSIYELKTLPVGEKLAIQLARLPSTVSSVESAGALISRMKKSNPSLLHTFEVLKWGGGGELRIYGLGPENILQEYAYSFGRGNNRWYQGELHKLGIVLDPDSGFAAIRLFKGDIRIYYQDPDSGFIQALCLYASKKGTWVKGHIIVKAVKGSNVAAVACTRSVSLDWVDAVHVYYQGLDLHLKEQVWSPDGGRWVSSSFDGGPQPQGTPISATAKGSEVLISWKDGQNRWVEKTSRSNFLGDNVSSCAGDNGMEQLDGRD